MAASTPTAGRSIGVGVVGLGVMGRTHLEAYAAADRAGRPCRVVCVSDRNAERLDGQVREGGNLTESTRGKRLFDPALVRTTRDPIQLFADGEVELVSICTPTDSHVGLALAALRAGKHVLVEKPVSLDAGEIERLDLAARQAGRLCMPAMCMRFWPGWSWLAEAVRDARYGAVLSATFQRLASRPSWGHGFYADTARSGGALFDLHIHDVDFVRHLFGDPDAVESRGSIDHATTHYRFARGPAQVVAEGGWDQAADVPFRMGYRVVFERATAEFDSRRRDPLEIVGEARAGRPVDAGANSGYDGEIRHMLDCVRTGRPGTDVTLADAAAVTRILVAERHSLTQGIERNVR